MATASTDYVFYSLVFIYLHLHGERAVCFFMPLYLNMRIKQGDPKLRKGVVDRDELRLQYTGDKWAQRVHYSIKAADFVQQLDL